MFVPLIDTLAGKGIKFITVAASLLALVGTGFLELGDAHASWNDLWCVAQAAGFGLAFTRIEVCHSPEWWWWWWALGIDCSAWSRHWYCIQGRGSLNLGKSLF